MNKGRGFKEKVKSTYKGVTITTHMGVTTYTARFTNNGRKKEKDCPTEREAAVLYDKWRIEAKKEPVNILIRK